MTCDKCAAREKAEARERESCNQERERLDTQSKRLTIMLTVLSTLVGKEILDKAAGIFDVVGEVSSLTDSSFGGEDYSTMGSSPLAGVILARFLQAYPTVSVCGLSDGLCGPRESRLIPSPFSPQTPQKALGSLL